MGSDSIKLSLLICTIPKRAAFMERLLNILMPQIYGIERYVEIEIDAHPTDSIGTKRNRLLQKARGKYVAFIDDDDRVSETYVLNLLIGIDKGVDCCSLLGIITDDGENPRYFEHSLSYNEYRTVKRDGRDFYERFPNHVSCIRADIAKQFIFPETNHGEDTDWAAQIHRSGQLMTEHYIEEVIYFYDYRTKK